MPDAAYEQARADILKAWPRRKFLDLSGRNLTALPPEIARLTALQNLFLNHNQLTALPPEIARLTALLHLGLENNQLTALPASLGTLTALERAPAGHTAPSAWGLFIEDNPLPEPYPSLIDSGQPAATRNVLAYLRGATPTAPPDPPPAPETAQPTIPPSRPAAIRVVMANGKLTLDPTPSQADLNETTMAAAIAALKTTMADLLEDAASDPSNFDRRPLNPIRRALDRMPGMPMPTGALFELAHLHEMLGKFARLIADQWPDALVAQFTVVFDNLGRVVAHFPDWEAFKAGARPPLTPEQAKAAPDIAHALAAELRAEESRQAVDETIPEALDQLASLRAMLQNDSALDLLAPDILESISNILKPIAAIAMQANPFDLATVNKAATTYGREARKSFIRGARKAGQNFGQGTVKWARRFLLAGAASTAASHSAAALTKAYPHIFGWLEPILTLLPRLL